MCLLNVLIAYNIVTLLWIKIITSRKSAPGRFGLQADSSAYQIYLSFCRDVEDLLAVIPNNGLISPMNLSLVSAINL